MIQRHGHKGVFVYQPGKISDRRHFKEKVDILSLANREIMVDDKGSHFKAMFPDIFADYQNPSLTGDVEMANKAWQIWQNTPLSWWQCQLNFTLWCASAGCGVSFEDHLQAEKPLLASLYRFHVYHTTRRLLEELRVSLLGDKSYSWYENAKTPEPTSGFVLSSPFLRNKTGGRNWITDVKISDLRVSSWLHLKHIDMRMWCKAHSSTRRMPCVITVISQAPGRRSFLRNRRASRRWVWSVLMTRSANMFGPSWESKPRRGRIFSRPGRNLTHRKNFWQISKTRLPSPLTSPVASLAIRKHHSNMHPHSWTSSLGLESICRPATWHSIRAISRGITTRSR